MESRQSAAALSDWQAVVTGIREVFVGLGELTEDEQQIAFASRSPDVSTGLALHNERRRRYPDSLCPSLPRLNLLAAIHPGGVSTLSMA